MSNAKRDKVVNKRSSYVEMETPSLLSLIAEGNEQAFAELYTRYYRKLQHFVLKKTSAFGQSDSDILQEVFFRLWINRDRLHEIENFNAWIYKVVANECLTLIKAELHQQTKKDRLEQWNKSLPASTISDKQNDLSEIKHVIHEAIDSMPAKRRQIYALSREEGLSPSQIADQLNIALPTVYNTLSTALKQIRNALIKAGYEAHLLILLLLELI